MIVISAQENISVAVNFFFKLGASDYLVKDDHTKDQLWNSILKIRENLALKQEVEELKGQLEQKFSFQKPLLARATASKSICFGRKSHPLKHQCFHKRRNRYRQRKWWLRPFITTASGVKTVCGS